MLIDKSYINNLSILNIVFNTKNTHLVTNIKSDYFIFILLIRVIDFALT